MPSAGSRWACSARRQADPFDVSTRLGVPGVTAVVIVLIPLAGYAITPEAMLGGAAMSFLIRGFRADGIALYVLWRYLGLVPFMTESRPVAKPD
jgi:hypothetical protein